MGIGHEILQVEGITRTWVWTKDNIEVDLQEIGKRILDFVQDKDRWHDL
jgi:hypothetical protein